MTPATVTSTSLRPRSGGRLAEARVDLAERHRAPLSSFADSCGCALCTMFAVLGRGAVPMRVIDDEVRKVIHESHEQAKRLLSAHRKSLDALVQALLEQETLDEQEILGVTGLPPASGIPGARQAEAAEASATPAARS